MSRSQTFHDTDGVDQEWEVSFTGGYLSREHVAAYFYPTGDLTEPRQPVTFSWVTDSLIRVTPALPAGGKLLIQRTTPLDGSVVRFADLALLTKADLQTAVDQAVLAVAELVDQYEDPDLLNALADARTAAATAVTAGDAAADAAAAADTSADVAQAAQFTAQSALNQTILARDQAGTAKDQAVVAKDQAEAAQAAAEATNLNNAKTNLANVFTQPQRVSASLPTVVDHTDATARTQVPTLQWVEDRTGRRMAGVVSRVSGSPTGYVELVNAVSFDRSTLRVSVTRTSGSDTYPHFALHGPGIFNPTVPNGFATVTRYVGTSATHYTVSSTTAGNTRYWSPSSGPTSASMTAVYTIDVTIIRRTTGVISGYLVQMVQRNTEFTEVWTIVSDGASGESGQPCGIGLYFPTAVEAITTTYNTA